MRKYTLSLRSKCNTATYYCSSPPCIALKSTRTPRVDARACVRVNAEFEQNEKRITHSARVNTAPKAPHSSLVHAVVCHSHDVTNISRFTRVERRPSAPLTRA